jgi:hypothetical protein
MDTVAGKILKSNPESVLNAECIKLSGRSDVFNARSVNFSRNGLILVSRKAVKPGTNLIVRIKDLPLSQTGRNIEGYRTTGLAEVQWVEEIIDSDGLAYALGVSYIYTD